MGGQWYITVGYPGGEYVIKASTYTTALSKVPKCYDARSNKLYLPDIILRPVSDELMCWLSSDGKGWERILANPPMFRRKVCGGWLYADQHCLDSHSVIFSSIPILYTIKTIQ